MHLDSLRWTARLDQVLLPVFQVSVCFANCVPYFNSQSHPRLTLSNNLAASRILFLSSLHRGRSGPQPRGLQLQPLWPPGGSRAASTNWGPTVAQAQAMEEESQRSRKDRSDALKWPVCFSLLQGAKKRRKMGSVEGWELGKRRKSGE